MDDAARLSVSISSEAAGVVLTPTDQPSEYGIPTTIDVVAGPFRGRIIDRFFAKGLGRFDEQLAELHSTLSGTAELASLENALNVILIGNGKGYVSVRVKIVAEQAPPIKMEFGFGIDQSYLPAIRHSIRRNFLAPTNPVKFRV